MGAAQESRCIIVYVIGREEERRQEDRETKREKMAVCSRDVRVQVRSQLPFRLFVCLGLSTLAPLTASGPASTSAAAAAAAVFLGTAFFTPSFLLRLRACLERRAGCSAGCGGFTGEVSSLRITDGDGKGSGLPSAISSRRRAARDDSQLRQTAAHPPAAMRLVGVRTCLCAVRRGEDGEVRCGGGGG